MAHQGMAQHSTARHSMAQQSTAQQSMASIAWHALAKHSIIRYSMARHIADIPCWHDRTTGLAKAIQGHSECIRVYQSHHVGRYTSCCCIHLSCRTASLSRLLSNVLITICNGRFCKSCDVCWVLKVLDLDPYELANLAEHIMYAGYWLHAQWSTTQVFWCMLAGQPQDGVLALSEFESCVQTFVLHSDHEVMILSLQLKPCAKADLAGLLMCAGQPPHGGLALS